MDFYEGQSALKVCKIISRNHSEISSFKLIAHEVGINWRQLYKTAEERLEHFLEGLEHPQPITEREYSREEFLQLTQEALGGLEKGQVWSITSRVACGTGKSMHIPMMNFHPEINSMNQIVQTIVRVCGNRPGVLLDSGRFQHYYGDFLLEERQWVQFMSDFLMPTDLVSPRYIGHRLHDGYCTLRLTADDIYKPKIPKVIKVFD